MQTVMLRRNAERKIKPAPEATGLLCYTKSQNIAGTHTECVQAIMMSKQGMVGAQSHHTFPQEYGDPLSDSPRVPVFWAGHELYTC